MIPVAQGSFQLVKNWSPDIKSTGHISLFVNPHPQVRWQSDYPISWNAVSVLEMLGAPKGQAADIYSFVHAFRHGLTQTVSPGRIQLLFNSTSDKICLETWTLPPFSNSFASVPPLGLFNPESSLSHDRQVLAPADTPSIASLSPGALSPRKPN